MRRIDHPARLHKDPHMGHMVDAVPACAPKQHVPRLGLRAGDMLAHFGVVLLLRRAGDGAVAGFARCVLGQAGTVKADEIVAGQGPVGRGAFAATAAVDVGDLFRDPVFGSVDERFTGTAGWGFGRWVFDAALGAC